MKPATESEVLVFFILLAPIPASLTTDRATAFAKDADIVTTHKGNDYITNQLDGVGFLKERKQNCNV